MSKSTNGLRKVGLASLAVTLTLGAGILSAGSANAVADFKFDRIAGSDRFDTAKQVASNFDGLQSFDEVILVNGQRGFYADALAAAHLAGDRQIPILLTKVDETPQFTLDALKAGGVTKITIVGGEGVVSADQEAALAEDYTVTRIEGLDRYKTNAEVLKAAGTTTVNTGIVAAGNNFADALGASPAAYMGSPLGLAKVDDIDDDVKKGLVDSGIKKVVVLGGPTIVGPEVVAELEAAGLTVERVFGADRSQTSMKFADYGIKNLGYTNTAANVASGSSTLYGADALSGGPLTGEEKRPMLITMNVDNPGDLESWFEDNANTLKEGIIFGGNGAVSTRVQELLETAARTAPASATSRPELRSAQITGTVRADQATPGNPAGTTVVYTFDENVSAVATGATALFHAYNADRSAVGGGTVVSTSGNTVTVRFNDADTAAEAGAITVATVDAGAVTDTQGQGGTEGDAPLGTTGGGGTTTLPAGVTDAPDLVSVGNFRQASAAGKTAVDFTFDQPATVLGTTGYSLILTDGTQIDGDGPATDSSNPSGGTIAGGNGTTTITVIFTNPDGVDDNDTDGDATDPMVASGDAARGAIAPGTVKSGAATATAPAEVENVLQTVDVSNGGNTDEPDLVSVALRPGATATDADQALFTFDAPVATADATKFNLYDLDAGSEAGTGTAAVNASNRTQVLVTFSATAADDAVGGYVVDGAVVTAPNTTVTPNIPAMQNEQDEVGVSNTASSEGQTSGRTAGPDLTKVSLVRAAGDAFGNPGNWTAVYTFDEDVAATVAAGKFKLYAANGATYTGSTCAVTSPATGQAAEDVDNTVTCTAFGAATSDQIGAATLGTVDDAAVTEQTGGSKTNVEGAEFTEGGTGTATN